MHRSMYIYIVYASAKYSSKVFPLHSTKLHIHTYVTKKKPFNFLKSCNKSCIPHIANGVCVTVCVFFLPFFIILLFCLQIVVVTYVNATRVQQIRVSGLQNRALLLCYYIHELVVHMSGGRAQRYKCEENVRQRLKQKQ